MGDLMEEGEVRDMTPRLVGGVYRKFTNEKSKQKRTFGVYECSYCGKEFETMVQNVKTGLTKSCGCLVGKNITHGFSYHNFYTTWDGMLSRCNNSRSVNYKNYGARGITVCEEWLDPKTFLEWCDLTHPNQEGYTLDRIDNDKGYSPENCRWTDRSLQSINQRMKKNNTSGYVGVAWNKTHQLWVSYIHLNKKRYNIGTFKDKMEAVVARDKYILENKFPHKLSTDYEGDK